MASPPAFTAIYEHDAESGAWLVHVKGVDGCHTYGRTRAEAESRLREALAAWLDRDADGLAITSG